MISSKRKVHSYQLPFKPSLRFKLVPMPMVKSFLNSLLVPIIKNTLLSQGAALGETSYTTNQIATASVAIL